MRNYLPFLLLILMNQTLLSQNITQIVRGKVMEEGSYQAIPGATVIILGSEPLKGSITDINGNFRLEGVPIGRLNLRISYLGYEPAILNNLLVSSTKELVLEVRLIPSTFEMEPVTIKAEVAKDQALNSMSIISARQLSVEESRRYAGGMDDPARLASVFAGVASDMSGNGISIRGNAPKGLLWSLEDVQIPNPNHFANVTAMGGGAFTALSSQLLANSDFYTSAFPAEYGNALSGVFDLRMRNGNSEHHEHTFQAGLLGLDFASEGPMGLKKGESYLINYRYSTFSILGPILPEDAGKIRYQDISFKLYLPVAKAGVFTLWGLGSSDVSGSEAVRDSSKWKYLTDKEKTVNEVRFAALGLAHKNTWGKKVYSSSTIAYTTDELIWNTDRLDNELNLQPYQRIEAKNARFVLSSKWNIKWSPTHLSRSCVTAEQVSYSFLLKHMEAGKGIVGLIDEDGRTWLYQASTQSHIQLSAKLRLNAGLHYQYFALNRAQVIEPRAGISWKLQQGQQLTLGYGQHSQTEPLPVYLLNLQNENGAYKPNLGLSFSKAHHLVLAYDIRINEFLRFKAEPYIQWLYDIPTSEDGLYSLQNMELDWFVNRALLNRGKGRNIGVDLTVERFMNQGFYYLFTATIFDSKYQDMEGSWHNSRFNKRYIANILFGKEWAVGRSKQNLLGASLRLNLQGGNWRTPLDEEASLEAQEIIEDESRMFTAQEPNVVHLDLSINYRKNREKWSGVWSLQMINILGAKEFYGYQINIQRGQIEEEQEVIILPNLSYKIEF